jgi:hypothetical protein
MFTHAGFQRTDKYEYQFIQNLNKEVKMIKFEKRGRTMELGSGFDMDLYELNLSPNGFSQYIGNRNHCLFDSARSALKTMAHVIGSGNILLPEYICESVIKCFPVDRIILYKLKQNLQIDADDLFNKINKSTAVVYLMHYFGTLQPENILSLLRTEKDKFGFKIIEDTTHSIFTKTQTIGDYCVASLRKWFPLPNGGVLYASVPLNTYDEIPRNADNTKAYAMMLKQLHLLGRLDCNPEYRALFTACEEKLDNQKEIKRISDFSEFLLNCYDVDDMVKRRAFNLNYLKNILNSLGIMQLCDFAEGDCPFTLPILVPERDAFRSYLMENSIYCAVHWPFDGFAQEQRPLAVSLSGGMLSLPIDQRYGEKEMEYLAEVIGAYKGRLQL